MPNLSSTSNSKPRHPLAAVGIFLALVVVVETTLALLPENALVKTFRSELPATSPTWQVMGDSVAQSGIVATQLQAALPPGQTVFNMATPASGPEFPYFQLKRELAAGKAPQKIIYAPSPHTFASKRVPLLVGGFCSWPEVLEVGRTGMEPMDVLFGVLCKLSYTLRHREEIVKLLKRQPATEVGTPAVERPMDGRRPRFTPDNLNATYKRGFAVLPFNDQFFQKFLRLAEANHIPVYWVTMPVMPAVYESRKRFAFEKDYYQFLDGLQNRNAVELVQRDFLVWDEDGFSDQTHLKIAAAERFTKLLGGKLQSFNLPARPVNQTLP